MGTSPRVAPDEAYASYTVSWGYPTIRGPSRMLYSLLFVQKQHCRKLSYLIVGIVDSTSYLNCFLQRIEPILVDIRMAAARRDICDRRAAGFGEEPT